MANDGGWVVGKVIMRELKRNKNNKNKDFDITKTEGYREAMKDIEEGRIYSYNSLDDLLKELGIIRK